MIERLDYVAVNRPAIAEMAKAKAKDHMRSIDTRLRVVIELRVLQIDGCVYCVELHSADARAGGMGGGGDTDHAKRCSCARLCGVIGSLLGGADRRFNVDHCTNECVEPRGFWVRS